MILRNGSLGRARLTDMETGDIVRVIFVPHASSSDERPPLRAGEVLQCIENSNGSTLVARPDGSRLAVKVPLGSTIEVELFWDPAHGWSSDESSNPAA